MKLTLYRMFGEDNRINKASYREVLYSLTGTLRSETSITSPVIEVHLSGTIDLKIINYAYIEEFNRFYFIDDIISVRNEVWEFHFRVDVLQSYYSTINDLPCIVARTSNKEYVSKDLLDDITKRSSVKSYELVEEYDIEYFDNIDPGTITVGPDVTSRKYFVVTLVAPDTQQFTKGVLNENAFLNDPMSPFRGGSPFYTRWLMTKDEIEVLSNIVADNSEWATYIISIRCFPINLGKYLTLTPGQVYLGKNIVGGLNNVSKITESSLNVIVSHSKISAIRKYNDFRDFEPFTSFQLYVPYYGLINIDANFLYSGNSYYDIYVSYADGNLIYAFYYQNGNDKVLYKTLTTNIGMEYPISSTNQQEIDRKKEAIKTQAIGGMFSSIGSLIAGLVMMSNPATMPVGIGFAVGGGTGLIGTGSNAISSAQQIPDASAYGADMVSSSGVYGPTNLMLFKTEYEAISIPYNHNAILGQPSMRTVEHISDLGSNVILYVYDCHLDGITALKTEKDEIYRLLRSGVIT